MRESHIRFIRQQGFSADEATEPFYSALMLQPRIIGVVIVLGIVAQSPLLFLLLSAVLLWSAIVPTRNPIDAGYNLVARLGRLPLLPTAPAPRRFATGLAGTFALAVGFALVTGAAIAAWIIEGLLVVALIQVVFGDFCAGANFYYRLQRHQAVRTPPPGAIHR